MIKSCAKRLVVIELEQKEEKKSVLILPSKQDQVRAIIIAKGSEVDKNLNEGDIVYLPMDTGIHVDIEGQKLLSISENQILAVLEVPHG